jgi:hypothetical protein
MTWKLGDVIPAGLFPKPTAVQRGCFGKRPFPSQGAADAALRAMLRAGYCRDGEKLKTYQCKRCLRWHFGHDNREAV